MVRFKIHFFLYNGALGATLPFVVVFAKERLGLAATSMGAVLTAQMFLFIFQASLATSQITSQTQIHHLCPDHPQYDVLFLDACSPKHDWGEITNSSHSFERFD
ncbi:hypothetical protein HNY73_011737 [Argiope bruennichi]|uniref:Uncharacterized protein n=1 Tax=Argiope bruennichi TaxID=94029 RepID=A0A8T0F4V8_ARGBR|nr:hypothetical protein HNY73_011737 [Argiope bruennichi]